MSHFERRVLEQIRDRKGSSVHKITGFVNNVSTTVFGLLT